MRLTLLFAFVAASTSLFAQVELKINNDNAKIEFVFTDDNTVGTIKGFDAAIIFDPADLSNSKMTGSVDVKTLSTKNGARDKHLKSKDYFKAKKFPKISFTSTSIEASENGFKMTGMLTIKDVEKEVTFEFAYKENIFSGDAVIFVHDFGMMTKNKREETEVKVHVEVPVS